MKKKAEEMTVNYYGRNRKKDTIRDYKTGAEIRVKSRGKARITSHNRQECSGGCRTSGLPRKHHSGEEAQYCDKLRLMRKGGAIKDYRAQVRIRLHDAQGKPVQGHIVDFEVTYHNGMIEFHEYKGFETTEWKLKAALVTWCHPTANYQVKKRGSLL